MTIYIDADACPVTRIAERIAKEYGIPVVLLCDTNHVLTSDYSEIRVIGAGADAVDIALINLCRSGDIVVTQDYGVAALARKRPNAVRAEGASAAKQDAPETRDRAKRQARGVKGKARRPSTRAGDGSRTRTSTVCSWSATWRRQRGARARTI